jgi:zinc and cadmium transporter
MLMLWVLGFSVLGSLGAIAGAALMLLFPVSIRKTLVPSLVSYATGTLLGAAFLGLIPKAIQLAEPRAVSVTVLIGILLFFVLEKWVLWRHCHDSGCEVHRGSGPLILIGDVFHNFVDGVVIAAAFTVSIPFGIAAALAVVAHEIPQELGDFAILLDNGYSRTKALLLNSLSAGATVPGAVAAYFWFAETRHAVPYMLALSAASFIYIALADLIPVLHQQAALGKSLSQFGLLLAGVATIALFHF